MKTNQYISGFTLIEMVTTLIIASSLFIGMMNITVHITKNIERDALYEDLKHYSTHVMDRISSDIKDADSINIRSLFGSWQIDIYNKSVINNAIVWNTDTYRENNETGMTYNDQPISSSGFGLFNNDKYDIDFEFTPKCSGRSPSQVLGFSDTSDNGLRTNYFEMNFDIEIRLSSNDDPRIFKKMTFSDRVFAQNMYLRSL